ncbi:Equilibrative nucleoside transporter 1 [Halotydeus destructor]|nr:Equilibrative nucleoside transporter 1 [Halotydeus destructor]
MDSLSADIILSHRQYFSNFKFKSTNESDASTYSQYYLQYVGIATNAPNLVMQCISILKPAQESVLTVRLLAAVAVEAILLVITTILTMVDSTSWPGVFFYITMASVVVINIANGVYLNCLFGMAAILPMSYINAVVMGMNSVGVYSSLLFILSIALSPDPQVAAFWYFLSAVVFLIICFISYCKLVKQPYYESYLEMKRTKAEPQGVRVSWATYLQIAKKCWHQLFNVFFAYFSTLLLFPAVLAGVQPLDGVIAAKYFSPVFCFLSFNVFTVLGSMMVNDRWPKIPANKLWIAVVARVIFVPFFLYCNYLPSQRSWPVAIETDLVFALGVVIFALSFGYLSSLAMAYAPKSVTTEHAPVAGMMASLVCIAGCLTGVSSAFILANIVR